MTNLGTMKMISDAASTATAKCPQCPLYVSRARMGDHMKMTHRKSMGSVTIAPKSMLKSMGQRTGLVVTPITSTTTVHSKPKVLQGQNPNLRPLLPKVMEEMVGCQVCKKQVQGSLITFHMEQFHKGATLPAGRTVVVAPKVPDNILMRQIYFPSIFRWNSPQCHQFREQLATCAQLR